MRTARRLALAATVPAAAKHGCLISDGESQEKLRHRLKPLQAVRPAGARTVARLVPSGVKRRIRERAKKAILRPAPLSLPFVPDREIARLQSCRYQLPIDKAQRVLGYRPSVSFREGCARTEAWLRFAVGMDNHLPRDAHEAARVVAHTDARE